MSICASETGRERRSFSPKSCRRWGLLSIKAQKNGAPFEKDGGGKASEFFGFTEDANHRPNETRIAFWAETREQVNRVAKIVREAGGQNLEGPQIWPDHSPGYYALFFEDPDGNKLEICCRGSAIVAE